jgi:hypothetical protein
MTIPREFRNRIASHNRHAIAAAALCLLGSWLSWTLAYALVVGLTLGFLTAIHGEEVADGTRLLSLPGRVHPAAIAVAAVLLIWGAIDHHRRRFRTADDRPIIGFHILGDVLLAPARLTFGIWEHLGAMIRLNDTQMREAFALLCHIYREKKCSRSSLGPYFVDAGNLPCLLEALQLAGWIDLLRSGDDWCYIIPSTEEETVAGLVGDAEAA